MARSMRKDSYTPDRLDYIVPDCDYCDAQFEDEDAYLGHLESEHYGELSRIDRRRVDEHTEDSGPSTGQVAAMAVGAVVVIGLVLFVGDAAGVVDLGGLLGGDGGTATQTTTASGPVIPEGIESEPLQDSGDAALLENVETYEHSNRNHVSAGRDIEYERTPPTGGPHYASTGRPGFYDQPGDYGQLVHNLEHGHVVVYYDPAAISSPVEESLRRFAENYDDSWSAVVVVQNAEQDPQSDYVLTAWGARLRMDNYDARVVKAFIDEYIGRGPENPVR